MQESSFQPWLSLVFIGAAASYQITTRALLPPPQRALSRTGGRSWQGWGEVCKHNKVGDSLLLTGIISQHSLNCQCFKFFQPQFSWFQLSVGFSQTLFCINILNTYGSRSSHFLYIIYLKEGRRGSECEFTPQLLRVMGDLLSSTCYLPWIY